MLAALKDLDRLYDEIESEVLGESSSGTDDSVALSRSQQLIARLEQAGTRIATDVRRWLEKQDQITLEEREQVRNLAGPIGVRASRLLARCRDRSAKLESRLSGLRGQLCEVQNGARFLQSTRPARANYPKFIDSLG
jgi:hypothetical protein